MSHKKVTKKEVKECLYHNRALTLDELAKKVKWKKDDVLEIVRDLEKEGFAMVKKHLFGSYGIFATPKLITTRHFEEEKVKSSKEKDISPIITQADKFYWILNEKKTQTVKQLGMQLGVPTSRIFELAHLVQEGIDITYPLNIFKSPRITLKPPSLIDPLYPLAADPTTMELLEKYDIVADNIPVTIELYNSKKDSMPLYFANKPNIDRGTLLALNIISENIQKTINVSVEDISDRERMQALKGKFSVTINQEISKVFPDLESDSEEILSGMIIQKIFGLGDLEILLSDDWLEEVCINTSHVPSVVYHKNHGWCKTNISFTNEKMVYNYASQIGRKVGKGITTLNPLLDAHMLTGDRVNASLYPISSFGNTMTIRRFAREPWTIAHFLSPKQGTLSKEIAAFLWLCFQYELNVIVGGGTASGKTSFLNSLLSFIQPTHRVISIEDTREINLPKYHHWNWVPLTTRQPNPDGKGEVSMLNLIVNSLRMRPDRIIVGEVRQKREAEVLFEAMHTGHSVYSTIHADTSQNLKRRLLEPPFDLPSTEVEALHLMIIQYRNRSTGKRRTFEVAEVVPAPEKDTFELNYVFRYNTRRDDFMKVNDSVRVMEEINLHSGMTTKEIDDDLLEKESVLQFLLDSKRSHVDQVGEVIDRYYREKDDLIKDIKNSKF